MTTNDSENSMVNCEGSLLWAFYSVMSAMIYITMFIYEFEQWFTSHVCCLQLYYSMQQTANITILLL